MFTEVQAGRDRLGRVKKNKERYKSYDGFKKEENSTTLECYVLKTPLGLY